MNELRALVRLHGSAIGDIAEAERGFLEFRFRPSYLEQVPRPVLGQRFEDDLERPRRGRKSGLLPDFFANLAPEGLLRDVLAEALALDGTDDLALLLALGVDLPGAVTVHSPEEPGRTGVRPDEGLRFSVAGVQLKLSVLLEEEKLTLPGRGEEGSWIVKFPSLAFPRLPENEASMLAWARAADFDVPEHQLLPADAPRGFARRYAREDHPVLAVRRYDRSPDGRIHQEDFAQVVGLPPGKKYDQITHEQMVALARAIIGPEGVEELIRRLALVVATGNNDAHLKNWSLLYPDRITARWTPLYDQVATVAWPDTDRELALKLAGVKAFHRIDRAAWERLARRADLAPNRVLTLAMGTLETLRDTWRHHADTWPLPEGHRQALREHWRRVPWLKGVGELPVD